MERKPGNKGHIFRRTIAILTLVAILSAFGVYTAWRSSNGSTDFDTYYYAARGVLERTAIYSDQVGRGPYIYPPLFACLMIPFTLLDIRIAAFVWYFVSVALFIGSLAFSSMIITGKSGKLKDLLGQARFLPKVLFLAIAAGMFFDNMSMLQANILVFFLSLLSLYCLGKGKVMSSAAFLAAAISIKIIPVVFLAYFVIRKKLKAAIFTVLFTALFSIAAPAIVMGPERSYAAFEDWTKKVLIRSVGSAPDTAVLDTMFSPSNQSVEATLSRFLIRNDYKTFVWRRIDRKYLPFMAEPIIPLSAAQVSFIAKAVVSIFAIVSLLILPGIRGRNAPGSIGLEYAIIFMVGLMVNPILRTQQFVFMLFPALAALPLCGKPGSARKAAYYLYVSFAVLFILQAAPDVKALGAGTLSMVCLWYLVWSGMRKQNNV